MGTVVRFERPADTSDKPRQPSLTFEVQAKLAIDARRIERATSACEAVVDCIESLQRSLATLDDLQRALLACEDGQSVEFQTTEVQSQLSSQLESVAGILRTLGDASEQLSSIGSLAHQALT